MKTSKVYVTSISKMPSVEHWAIIQDTSVHIPGDGARTLHGYPESTEHYITYTAYTDKAEFEDDLKRALGDQRRFGEAPVRGIHVAGLYTSEIVVHLNEKK